MYPIGEDGGGIKLGVGMCMHIWEQYWPGLTYCWSICTHLCPLAMLICACSCLCLAFIHAHSCPLICVLVPASPHVFMLVPVICAHLVVCLLGLHVASICTHLCSLALLICACSHIYLAFICAHLHPLICGLHLHSFVPACPAYLCLFPSLFGLHLGLFMPPGLLFMPISNTQLVNTY